VSEATVDAISLATTSEFMMNVWSTGTSTGVFAGDKTVSETARTPSFGSS